MLETVNKLFHPRTVTVLLYLLMFEVLSVKPMEVNGLKGKEAIVTFYGT
jgi:hypothetical protein